MSNETKPKWVQLNDASLSMYQAISDLRKIAEALRITGNTNLASTILEKIDSIKSNVDVVENIGGDYYNKVLKISGEVW